MYYMLQFSQGGVGAVQEWNVRLPKRLLCDHQSAEMSGRIVRRGLRGPAVS